MGNCLINTSELSNELRLLLEILKMGNNTEGAFGNKYLVDNVNWEEFIRLVKHHRVYPVIYSNLRKLEKEIPRKVFLKLKQLYHLNRIQMLYLGGDIEQLSKIFTSNGIRLIFLKGPVLGLDLYGDISLRTSSDLDILIPLKDLKKAEKLLLQNGYVKDDYISTVLGDWKWRHHHFTFVHKEKNIKVEIHWRLNPGPSKEPNFNDLWERKRVSKLTNFPVHILSREDLFIFLVSHGARHGWSRLRWLQDIDQLSKQKLDKGLILFLLRRYQFSQLGGQALLLSSNLLGTEIEEDWKGLTKGNRPKYLAQEALFYIRQTINLHSYPLPTEVGAFHQKHLFSLMSFRQKLLFIFSFLYPYPIDAETLPLPKFLHPLYFPLRPFLCAWRVTKNLGPIRRI
jgi:hypothetical protein